MVLEFYPGGHPMIPQESQTVDRGQDVCEGRARRKRVRKLFATMEVISTR